MDKIESDSKKKTLESEYSEYSVHNHLWELRLALFEFPKSKYEYLIKDMILEKYEIDMIKDELEGTNFE
jgi:hypothetical protein